ncbi:TPR domain protein, putative component of TonB system [uncultured Gammaproteobacteria bacterium]|nr:TPR domain protein, putative component of TonB system [uncultured Gammaproteobacteria bacterium]
MTLEQLYQAVDKAEAEYNHEEYVKLLLKVVKLLSEIIAKEPWNVDAFKKRGVTYTKLKQFEKAVQDFDQAIKLNPKHANAFNNRGVAYADLKQFEKAIQDYDQAIKLNPKDADVFNNHGNAYVDLKKFEKAIQDYEQAIKLNPKHADAFHGRGIAYAGLKQFKKAIWDYDQAIELDPKYARPLYNRALAYRELGEEEKAIEDFKEAQELDPSIIVKEQIKILEGVLEKKITQTQESNTKVQGFQEILEGLEEEHKTEEENWFKWSQWAVFITLGLIVLVIILIACNIFESHDTYIVYIFSSIVTFSVIRQYTNAKALRIEASNRVAMAKMFERVKNENNEYQQEFLPKLSDAIVYSTIKAKNNSDGLVEKIINVLEKIKK